MISLASIGNTPSGHRYEIEVANDEEFTVGLDTRMIEGKDLSTTMTGRLPEEEHFIRVRMLGPQDDATVIASAWVKSFACPLKQNHPKKFCLYPSFSRTIELLTINLSMLTESSDSSIYIKSGAR